MSNVNTIAQGPVSASPVVPVEKTVATEGGDFTSIKAAIDSITDATSSKPYLVTVSPGIFTENPIACKEYVYLEMSDGVIVQPSGNLNPLFSLADHMHIDGGQIIGPTGSAAFLAATSITKTLIQDIFITSGQVGFSVVHPTGTLTVINSRVTASQYGFHVSGSGANLIAMTIQDFSDTSFYASFGGNMHIHNAISNSSTNGLYAQNIATEIHALSIRITDATNAIRVALGAEIKGGNIEVENSITNDLLQDDASSYIRIWGSLFRRTKLSIVDWRNISVTFDDDTANDEGSVFSQQVEVGTPELGREAIFGGGDSYTRGMLVYTKNASGTFVNVSTEAGSVSGSTFGFPGTGINNSIYVTSSLPNSDSTDVLKHHGLKILPIIACIPGSGEVVAEYYSTGAWVEFNHMSTRADTTYLPYAKQVFERVQSEQIRYDYSIQSLWTESDEPSLSTNYYWMRLRVKTAVDRTPTLQQFKLHTSRAELNADGYIEFFGTARTFAPLPNFTLNIFDPISPGPGDSDVFIGNAGGDRIGYGLIDNRFASGATNNLVRAMSLPIQADTSGGLVIKFRYFLQTSSGAGENIRFEVQYGWTSDGDAVVDSTASTGNTTITTVTKDVTVDSQAADIALSDEITIDISDMIARRASAAGDTLWLKFQRDGGTDTFSNSIILFELSAEFLCWTIGAHLS